MTTTPTGRPYRSTINDPTYANYVEIIGRFAAAGRDDPSIADTLNVGTNVIARIRRYEQIEPGETRWLGTAYSREATR